MPTVHSERLNVFCSLSCAIRLLYQLLPLYPDFSGSRHDALGGVPRGYRRPSLYPFRGFFPAFGLPLAGRLLLRPEGLYLLMRTVLRHRFPIGGFRLPSGHHCQEADLPGRYPCRIKLSFPCASKHWRALFIELIIRMVQIWNCQAADFGYIRKNTRCCRWASQLVMMSTEIPWEWNRRQYSRASRRDKP